MNLQKINNKGQARLFDNKILESLSKTRPWVIYVIYVPICFYMLYYSYQSLHLGGLFITGLFLLSMFSWTLFEYVAHRYIFHMKPKSQIGKKWIYIFHGNHHEFPRDQKRLFMPPVPSIIVSSLVFFISYALCYVFTGNANYAFIYFPGFMSGYLIYVSLHYAIHVFPPPKGMKAIWRYHHLHHYTDSEHGFGVSSPFWDIVFGTIPKKDSLNN